jgi:RNase P subunit RPR2
MNESTAKRIVLFCLSCGGTRSIIPGQKVQTRTATGMSPVKQLACFRCGGQMFTQDKCKAPIFPVGICWTVLDRRFLKSLRIAPV